MGFNSGFKGLTSYYHYYYYYYYYYHHHRRRHHHHRHLLYVGYLHLYSWDNPCPKGTLCCSYSDVTIHGAQIVSTCVDSISTLAPSEVCAQCLIWLFCSSLTSWYYYYYCYYYSNPPTYILYRYIPCFSYAPWSHLTTLSFNIFEAGIRHSLPKGFQAFIAGIFHMTTFWVMIPRKFPGLKRRFGETCWLSSKSTKSGFQKLGRNSVTPKI